MSLRREMANGKSFPPELQREQICSRTGEWGSYSSIICFSPIFWHPSTYLLENSNFYFQLWRSKKLLLISPWVSTICPTLIYGLKSMNCTFFLASSYHNHIISNLINRPGVAGAVLQTPLLLTDWLIQSAILCENIFKSPSLPNRKS